MSLVLFLHLARDMEGLLVAVAVAPSLFCHASALRLDDLIQKGIRSFDCATLVSPVFLLHHIDYHVREDFDGCCQGDPGLQTGYWTVH
jgi:hypothetical protein